ncbi:MAG TPA: nucleoid occlusion factor SlmA [Cellvibrio sp.]|nr:nucleoid occlusion factor SlmA [Cellvibrio sp.]
MSRATTKIPRRQQILAALAKMLEESPGERITTSALAKLVGVSEAALYRHFPSKTKMFEGLIEAIEETVFNDIAIILAEEKTALVRCEKIVLMLLSFVERNPGLSRLLVGDALTGETERLRQRIAHFFYRIETQLIQVLSESSARDNLYKAMPVATSTHLLMAYIDGCMSQFVRSEFQRLPTAHWLAQWQVMAPCLL